MFPQTICSKYQALIHGLKSITKKYLQKAHIQLVKQAKTTHFDQTCQSSLFTCFLQNLEIVALICDITSPVLRSDTFYISRLQEHRILSFYAPQIQDHRIKRPLVICRTFDFVNTQKQLVRGHQRKPLHRVYMGFNCIYHPIEFLLVIFLQDRT